MIKIVKADSEGNINLTEKELNILLKEAYNEGYDRGYAYGRSSENIKWYYKPLEDSKQVNDPLYKYNDPISTSCNNTCCKHDCQDYSSYTCNESENGIPQ